MPAPRRTWTDNELRRMKAAVEGGVLRDVIAIRWPGARPMSKTQATLPAKYVGRPPKPRGGTFFNPNRPAFTPAEGGCAVRVLSGAEFKKRKQELEARDRDEREKQPAYPSH